MFLFPKQKKLYLSRKLSYVDDIWFDDRIWLSEEMTSTIGKPEVVLSARLQGFRCVVNPDVGS